MERRERGEGKQAGEDGNCKLKHSNKRTERERLRSLSLVTQRLLLARLPPISPKKDALWNDVRRAERGIAKLRAGLLVVLFAEVYSPNGWLLRFGEDAFYKKA